MSPGPWPLKNSLRAESKSPAGQVYRSTEIGVVRAVKGGATGNLEDGPGADMEVAGKRGGDRVVCKVKIVDIKRSILNVDLAGAGVVEAAVDFAEAGGGFDDLPGVVKKVRAGFERDFIGAVDAKKTGRKVFDLRARGVLGDRACGPMDNAGVGERGFKSVGGAVVIGAGQIKNRACGNGERIIQNAAAPVEDGARLQDQPCVDVAVKIENARNDVGRRRNDVGGDKRAVGDVVGGIGFHPEKGAAHRQVGDRPRPGSSCRA